MDAGPAALRIEIFVDDVERSAAFYERALGFSRDAVSPGYVSMRRGGAVLGIGAAAGLPAGHYFTRDALARRGAGVEIVIEVDDVDRACAAVIGAGHPILVPPGQRPWGARDFRIADPDGYYLRITSR
jgi:catechol 2,3-dioxygenase-like lactoylglutathione lyase family enzyme